MDLLQATALEAGSVYAASVGLDFEASAVAYAQGRALEVAGAHEAALDRWLQALDEPTARGWPALMNGVVRAARRLGREREVAEGLLEREARIPELGLWAGHLYRLAGAPLEALGPLERAGVLPQLEVRYTALTEELQVLVDLGRLERAIARCREGIEALPTRALLLRVSLGGLLTRAGQPAAALEVLDAVLLEAPNLGVAQHNRGLALRLLEGA